MRIRPECPAALVKRGHVTPAAALIHAAVLAALAAAVPAQRQFEELVRGGLPPDRDSSAALALGDVDGDGDLDAVVGNDGQQNRLYLDDGNGTYTDETASRLPIDSDDTQAVALGDMDGDGDLDIVVGNGHRYAFGQQNRLYLNDGTGTFIDATADRLPAILDHSQAVALGDVDGDGDLDIVVGNGLSYGAGERNRLYLNGGTGFFSDATALRLPAHTEDTNAVALGDVDGDGDLDMALANGIGGRIFYFHGQQDRLYLNDGAGSYTDVTASHLPVDANDTHAVQLGDVDRDGDLDMVLGNWSYGRRNRLYMNDGTGRYVDGTLDRFPIDGERTLDVALSDVDGDGDLDAVFGNSRTQNRLYVNTGAGFFADATGQRMPTDIDGTRALATGDVDGDGDADMLLGNDPEQNRLYLNDGAGTYTDLSAARLPAIADESLAVALGDVDGDGDADMVFGNFRDQNRLYLNDGTGAFTDATAGRLPAISDFTTAMALGDVDGDGDLDIAFGNRGFRGYGEQNRLYLNDGRGRFTDVTAELMPNDSDGTSALALADVDGDGDLDMVIGNEGVLGGGQQNRLYLNDGAGAYTDVTAHRMPADNDYTQAVAVGDVNGDDALDIVFANVRQQNRLYLNDGTGAYTDVTAQLMPPDADRTYAVALADVDGDGDLDLVFGNGYSPVLPEQNRLYRNDGTGAFEDITATHLPPDDDRTHAVALGDVDEDGDLDLVLGNVGTFDAQNRLYLNDGTGSFSDATLARMPADADLSRSVALGDVDGDDDLDVVFGNGFYPAQQNRLYLNLHRQLTAPLLAFRSKPYPVRFHARPGYASSPHTGVAVLGLSLSPAPVRLGSLGTFFLDPTALLPLPAVAIPQQTGTAGHQLYIPGNASLQGVAIYFQGLVADFAAGEAHFTGYTGDVIR